MASEFIKRLATNTPGGEYSQLDPFVLFWSVVITMTTARRGSSKTEPHVLSSS